MSVINRPAQGRTSPLWIAMAIVIILAILVPLLPEVQQPWVAHVSEKRGTSNVEKTRKCNDDASATLFYNPVTGRYGKVCLLNGQWFVVIIDAAGRIVTGFPKEKMGNFAQVIQYMKNAGYTIIQ